MNVKLEGGYLLMNIPFSYISTSVNMYSVHTFVSTSVYVSQLLVY